MAEKTGIKQKTIGGLSKVSGVHIETIRYYERIKLLPKPSRTQGGYRLYGEESAKRLAFIRRSRELGFSLEGIRVLLGLADGKPANCAKVKAITQLHLGEVQRKILDLKKMESVLQSMIGTCKGGKVPNCPIIDALFH
jgi:MerR family mercuric resistance operon transcriptional regulator